jgi:predicted deacylase
MTRLWYALFLLFISLPAHALEFNKYHTQEEIKSWMLDLAKKHQDLVKFKFLGYSQQGREINYLIISKQTGQENLPALYFNGTHHGNEKSSTESILGLIDFIIDNRNEPSVSEILDNYTIYLQPIVNPDGHALHSRMDSVGRDPNRDYSFPERDEQDSFKIQDIRLVKSLVDQVKFRAAGAFHSGLEAILWPWCFTPQRNAEVDTFYTLSKLTAGAMGINRFTQSYSDYPTRGEFIDYVFMAHGTLALTFEVSAEPTPPASRLSFYVQRSVKGAMTFMRAVMALDRGTLQIQSAPDPKLVNKIDIDFNAWKKTE